MMSREQAGAALEKMGLRRVDQDSWMGFQKAGGRVFPIYAHLREVYVQVQVPLNLFTKCDQMPVYHHFSEANSRVAVGKFAVGPEFPQGGRLLVLVADLPAGPDPEYTSEETLSLLLRSAVELLEAHYDTVEALFRQGCRPGPGGVGRSLLDRLRVFRADREGQEARSQEARS